jgi:hypothetical protein
MPEPGQTVYWFTGNVENQLPLAIGMLAIWLLWRSGQTSTKPVFRNLIAALGLLLCVLATGLHEMSALVLSAVVGTGVLASQYLAVENRRVWLLACLLVLAGLAFNVLAPGNAVRAGKSFANAFSFSHTIVAFGRIGFECFIQ